jgi:hypothetical protein
MNQKFNTLRFNFNDALATAIIKDGGKMVEMKLTFFKCFLLLDGLTLLVNEPRMNKRAVSDIEELLEGF